MLVSSMTNTSPSSGLSWLCLKSAVLGSNSSSRWMVVASMPVVSLSRLAARPVGAQSTTFRPLALKICTIELTSVVLPTPGPPVMTITLDLTASAIASRWAVGQRQPRLLLHPLDRLGHVHRRAGVRAARTAPAGSPPAAARRRPAPPGRPAARLFGVDSACQPAPAPAAVLSTPWSTAASMISGGISSIFAARSHQAGAGEGAVALLGQFLTGRARRRPAPAGRSACRCPGWRRWCRRS